MTTLFTCSISCDVSNRSGFRLHGEKNNTEDKFSSTIGSAAGPIENRPKCAKCTYNLTGICIICGSTSLSAQTLHEHIQPLRITQNSDLAQSLSQSRNNSPPASLTNIENSRRSSQAKWMCSVSFSNVLVNH